MWARRLLTRARRAKRENLSALALAALAACGQHQQNDAASRAPVEPDFALRPTALELRNERFAEALGLFDRPAGIRANVPRTIDFAKETARWLRSVAIETPDGLVWPADPNDPKTVTNDLYSGSAGVVLFFLKLSSATNEKSARETAERGADALVASIPNHLTGEQAGLYTGVAGVGFVLLEAAKTLLISNYRDAARGVVDLLAKEARPAGAGIDWNDSRDVISGAAGTGLFLLYAAREMDRPDALDLAKKAGDHLLEVAIPEKGGLMWRMTPTYARNLPNFSHGTAGVAYFLARLYGSTKDHKYLDGALAGARYLLAVADTRDDGCRIFHADPDGLDRYYLGWCHGPAGTGQLFFDLWVLTEDQEWLDWLGRAERSLVESGIPESRPSGFWNNVSQCCGSAGIAEFLLSAPASTATFRISKTREFVSTPIERESRDLADHLVSDLLARGVLDERGLRWPQAEHRVKPDLVVAQTGFMQGAAGIGYLLVALHGTGRRFRFPDSPFAK